MDSKEVGRASPSAAAVASSGSDTDIDFGDVVLFLAGSWRLICLCAGVCGLIYVCWSWLKVPTLYQSTVTMILPAYSRYSPQGFQKLLESDAIVDKTVAELRSQHICASDEELKVGEDLKTSLQVAPVGNIVPSSLEVSAAYPDAKKAAAIATTWAAVFAQRVKEVATANPASALDKELLSIGSALAELESKQKAIEAQRAKQELDLQAQSQKQLSENLRATTEALAQHLRETAKLANAKEAENRVALAELKHDRPSLEWREAQLETLQKLELRVREEQANVAAESQAKLRQVDRLTQELAHVPQFLTVRKSAAGDPAARSQSGSAEKAPVSGGSTGLPAREGVVSEEINPLYTELSVYLVKLRAEAEPLSARAKQLAEDLKSLQDQATALDKTIQADEAAWKGLEHSQIQALLALQAEREVGRKALEQQQVLVEGQIKAQTNSALEDLRRDSKAQIAQLTREITQQSDLFVQASKVFNQARVETMQQGAGEIKVVRPALPALHALSRGLILRLVIAMFVGAVLGTIISLVRRSAWSGGS